MAKKRKQNQMNAFAVTKVISQAVLKGGIFIPENPLVKIVQSMFLDETTADVCFEVEIDAPPSLLGEGEDSVVCHSFHAHRLILQGCAPLLADLFETSSTDGGVVPTVKITGVKPDVFKQLLRYVYGGKIHDDFLKKHARDLLDASDKFSIVTLKLEAEAAYLKATKVNLDNAIEILSYAEAKNCALLKEFVLDFFLENHNLQDIDKKISMDIVPGHLLKDLIVFMSVNNKRRVNAAQCNTTPHGGNVNLMRVSELRKMLDAKGLDVDGSREAMIEALSPTSKKSVHFAMPTAVPVVSTSAISTNNAINIMVRACV
jgi:hypothetical protein